MFVGLDLLVGSLEGGLLVRGVFQLNHHQRHAVHKQHQVQPLLLLLIHHRELVDHQELVVLRSGKVDQPHPLATLVAVLLPAHRHALGQQAMEGFIAGQQIGHAGPQHVFHRQVHQVGRQPVVDAPRRLRQASAQQHLAVVAALWSLAVRRQFRAMHIGVTLAFQQLDGEGFDG